MSWGTKILFVYIAFITGIVFMVFISSTQKTDLVTTDYYAKELKYQEKIDEMKRVSGLSAPVTYELKGHTLVIAFPVDFSGRKIQGEVVLYCPSDEDKDIKKTFVLQDEKLQVDIPVTNSGLYQLQLSWQDGGVTYYFEKKIFI